MQEYAPEAYKVYNKELERLLQQDEKVLLGLKSRLLDVHAGRKKDQVGGDRVASR